MRSIGELDGSTSLDINVLVALRVSDLWGPRRCDGFAVAIGQDVVSELDTVILWIGGTSVDDHTLESQVGGVDCCVSA